MKICCKELSKIAQSGHTAGKLTVTKGATPSSFLAMIVIANIFVLNRKTLQGDLGNTSSKQLDSSFAIVWLSLKLDSCKTLFVLCIIERFWNV